MSLSLAALLSNTHYIHTEKNKDEAIVIMMLSHSSFFFLSFSVLLLHSTFLYIFCQKPLSYVFILDFLCTSFKYEAAHCLVVCYKKSKTFFYFFYIFVLPSLHIPVGCENTGRARHSGKKQKEEESVREQEYQGFWECTFKRKKQTRYHQIWTGEKYGATCTHRHKYTSVHQQQKKKNLCILFKKVVIFTTTATSLLLFFFGTIFPCVFPHYFCEIRAGVTTTAKHQAIKVHLPVQC